MLTRNHDPLKITLTVAQAESLCECLESFISSCGIPCDDPSEPLPAIHAAVCLELAKVPFISFAEIEAPKPAARLYHESNLPMSQFDRFIGFGQNVITERDTSRYDLIYGFRRVVAVMPNGLAPDRSAS